MKFIPQCKVIGPYNCDKIIHNIEKNYEKNKWKDAFRVKTKICVIH